MKLDLGATSAYLIIAQVAGALGRPLWTALSDVVMSGNRSLHLASVGMLAGAAYIILGPIPARRPLAYYGSFSRDARLGAFGNEGLIQMIASELGGSLRSGSTSARVLLPTWAGAVVFPCRVRLPVLLSGQPFNVLDGVRRDPVCGWHADTHCLLAS